MRITGTFNFKTYFKPLDNFPTLGVTRYNDRVSKQGSIDNELSASRKINCMDVCEIANELRTIL
jgi:hypothetical protein